MTAHSIPYIDLYVRDRKSSVYFLSSSFGFTEVAISETAERSSTLLRQGDVQLLVTSGPATEQFLERHGDGIADIAFGCEDVAATLESAIAAGGRAVPSETGATAVSGFGDVRHTLVHVPEHTSAQRPSDRIWNELAGPVATTSRLRPVQLLDHIAVCLDAGSLQDAVRYYIDGFGLDRFYSEYVEVGAQAMDSIVVRSPSGGVTFTIIEPDPSREPGQIDGFLARNGGAGVQHLAFLVDDIVTAVREFRGLGVEFLNTPDAYYDALVERIPQMRAQISNLTETNVLADCDEWGYLLQLFSRSPHEQNTLFYELIQRQGAQGFGSSNIRALYEAVERERVTSA